MSFQDSNQQPFPPPQQSWDQQGQQPQPAGQGPQPPQGSWGAPGQPGPSDGSAQGWGAQPPQQPGYGFGQGAAPGQSFGQPQDYGQQNFPQQPGYPQQQQQPQNFVPQQGGPQQQAFAPQQSGPAPQQQQGFVPQQSGPAQQQGFVPQQGYPGESYPGGGFASGPGGYPQQSDFGSGAGYGPGPGYPAPGPQQNSGLATASLWIGILGGWGLIGLIFSILGINDTGPGKKAGRGKAITGLCLTLAWTVVLLGISVALANHDKSVAVGAPPTDGVSSAASPGAGGGTAPTGGATAGAGGGGGATAAAGGGASPVATNSIYLTGATDPGCVTVQSAFNTMESTRSSASETAFITALQNGAGQSQVAGSQISAVASDWDGSNGTPTTSQIRSDMQAMESACGMSATATDPN